MIKISKSMISRVLKNNILKNNHYLSIWRCRDGRLIYDIETEYLNIFEELEELEIESISCST